MGRQRRHLLRKHRPTWLISNLALLPVLLQRLRPFSP